MLRFFGGHASRPNTMEGSAEQEVVLPTATATAHDGRVTALLPMPNGLSWLSAATDSRVRLWSVPHFRSGFVVIHRSAMLNFPLLGESNGHGHTSCHSARAGIHSSTSPTRTTGPSGCALWCQLKICLCRYGLLKLSGSA
jgi:hypothetical protein